MQPIAQPIVNCEEFIGKTVGRRHPSGRLQAHSSETVSNQQWQKAGFGLRVVRGVYRFHTHEEADQWLMDHLTQKQAN